MSGVLLLTAAVAIGAGANDSPMKKTKDGTYIVNTTTLCDAKGFRGATPVEVHIKNNKLIKVVALPNQDSPTYFAKVTKHLLPSFAGISVKDASKKAKATDVDGCTGATYSTRATQKNIEAALDYYYKHK